LRSTFLKQVIGAPGCPFLDAIAAPFGEDWTRTIFTTTKVGDYRSLAIVSSGERGISQVTPGSQRRR